MIRFILLLLFISCGKGDNLEHRFTNSHHFYANQTQVWKDSDKDGLQDRFDLDIDGDDIPNLADQYPYDITRFGKDSNNNGIADFIDFTYHPELQSVSHIQQRLLREMGIYLINAESDFTAEEVVSLEKIIFNDQINSILSFKKLKVIAKYPGHKRMNYSKASFDSHWQQISFYDVKELKETASFNSSFIHELGHLYQHESPEHYNLFSENPIFTTDYAHSSTAEAFADWFLYQIYLLDIFDLDETRFNLEG